MPARTPTTHTRVSPITRHGVSIALTLTGLCLLPPSASAATYAVTDLGTLGGSTSTIATDVNNATQVVGESDLIVGLNLVDYAFLWDAGSMSPLVPLGKAQGINSAGTVVGNVRTITSSSRAFIASGGSYTTLPSGSFSAAYAINDADNVVGFSTIGVGPSHAVMWENATTMIDLGTLGGVSSLAYDINNHDQVVGASNTATATYDNAFLWENGQMIALCPDCTGLSRAEAINDQAQVVGMAAASGSGAAQATLWENGETLFLGTLGGLYSYAYDINEAGQIVGTSAYGASATAYHAFLWDNGEMIDLNSLLDPGSGWTLTYAYAINDLGEIVGVGINPQGQAAAFLLTLAVPEPETWALWLAGLALVVLQRRPDQGTSK